MAINPSHGLTVSSKDQSNETGTWTLPTAEPTDLATTPTTVTAIFTALNAELHNLTNVKINNTDTRKLTNSSVGTGNREDKIEYTYQDNTTLALYQVEIPSRKGTVTTSPGSDLIPAASWTATKTALEAFMKSPDGNAVTVLQARLVGRNS